MERASTYRRLGSIASAMAALVVVSLAVAVPAPAVTVDLTTGKGATGTINGAVFVVDTDDEATGTGVFDPFLRIQASGTERGYNTSYTAKAIFDDKSPANYTHDIQLQDISTRTSDSVQYYEFFLDINESAGGGNEYLSLDALQLYTSPTGMKSTTTFSPAGDEQHGTLPGLGTLRYNLDAGDSIVLLDFLLIGSGSGRADMTALIPVSLFDGAAGTDYVYLYSYFGGLGTTGRGAAKKDWGASDGFEEWAHEEAPPTPVVVVVPEPMTACGLCLGVLGLAGYLRRRVAAA